MTILDIPIPTVRRVDRVPTRHCEHMTPLHSRAGCLVVGCRCAVDIRRQARPVAAWSDR